MWADISKQPSRLNFKECQALLRRDGTNELFHLWQNMGWKKELLKKQVRRKQLKFNTLFKVGFGQAWKVRASGNSRVSRSVHSLSVSFSWEASWWFFFFLQERLGAEQERATLRGAWAWNMVYILKLSAMWNKRLKKLGTEPKQRPIVYRGRVETSYLLLEEE